MNVFLNVRLSVILLSAVLCQLTYAETAIIVHPSNEAALSQDVVNKIFLGKVKSFPPGGTAVPISQKEGTAIRDAFDQVVVGKSAAQIKAYWAKLVFTGKGSPPKEADSNAAVKALVSSDASAIGYIDATEVDSTVKVAFTF